MDRDTLNLLQQAQGMLSDPAAPSLQQGVIDVLRQVPDPVTDALSRVLDVPVVAGTESAVRLLRPRRPLKVSAFEPPRELPIEPWQRGLIPPEPAGKVSGVQAFGRSEAAQPRTILEQLPAHPAYERPAPPEPEVLTDYDRGIIEPLKRKYPALPEAALEEMVRGFARLRTIADGVLRIGDVEDALPVLEQLKQRIPPEQRPLFLRIMQERLKVAAPHARRRFTKQLGRSFFEGALSAGQALSALPDVIGITPDAQKKRDDLLFETQVDALRRGLDPRPANPVAQGFYSAAHLAPQLIEGGAAAAAGGPVAATAFWAALMAPDFYKDFRSSGFSDTEARLGATALSVPTAALMTLELEQVLPPQLRQKVLRSATRKAARHIARAAGGGLKQTARQAVESYIKAYGIIGAQQLLHLAALGTLEAVNDEVNINWEDRFEQSYQSMRDAALMLPVLIAPGYVLRGFGDLARYRRAPAREQQLPPPLEEQPIKKTPSGGVYLWDVLAAVQRQVEQASADPQARQAARAVVTGEPGQRIARLAEEEPRLREAYIRTLERQRDQAAEAYVFFTKQGEELRANQAAAEMYQAMRLLMVAKRRPETSSRGPRVAFEERPTAERLADEEPAIAELLMSEPNPASRLAFRRYGLDRWFRTKREREQFIRELDSLSQPEETEATHAEQEPEATQLHGAVREEPQPGQGQVPAEEGGRGVSGGGPEERQVPQPQAQEAAQAVAGKQESLRKLARRIAAEALEHENPAVYLIEHPERALPLMQRVPAGTGEPMIERVIHEMLAASASITHNPPRAGESRQKVIEREARELVRDALMARDYGADLLKIDWEAAERQLRERIDEMSRYLQSLDEPEAAEIAAIFETGVERAAREQGPITRSMLYRALLGDARDRLLLDLGNKAESGAPSDDVPALEHAFSPHRLSNVFKWEFYQRATKQFIESVESQVRGERAEPQPKEMTNEKEEEQQHEEGHDVRREHGVRAEAPTTEEAPSPQQGRPAPPAEVAPRGPEQRAATEGAPAVSVDYDPKVVGDMERARSFANDYSRYVSKARRELETLLGPQAAEAAQRVERAIDRIDDHFVRLGLHGALLDELTDLMKSVPLGNLRATYHERPLPAWLKHNNAAKLAEAAAQYAADFRRELGRVVEQLGVQLRPTRKQLQAELIKEWEKLQPHFQPPPFRHGSEGDRAAQERWSQVDHEIDRLTAEIKTLDEKIERALLGKRKVKQQTLDRWQKELAENHERLAQAKKEEKALRLQRRYARLRTELDKAADPLEKLRWQLALLREYPEQISKELGVQETSMMRERFEARARAFLTAVFQEKLSDPDAAREAAADAHQLMQHNPLLYDNAKKIIEIILGRHKARAAEAEALSVIKKLPEPVQSEYRARLSNTRDAPEAYEALRKEAEKEIERQKELEEKARREKAAVLGRALLRRKPLETKGVSVTKVFARKGGVVTGDLVADEFGVIRLDAVSKGDRKTLTSRVRRAERQLQPELVENVWRRAEETVQPAALVGVLDATEIEVSGMTGAVGTDIAWFVAKDGTQAGVAAPRMSYLVRVLKPAGYGIWELPDGGPAVALLDRSGRVTAIVTRHSVSDAIELPVRYEDVLREQQSAGGGGAALAVPHVQPSKSPPPMASERSGKVVSYQTIFETNWQMQAIPPDVAFHMVSRLIGNEPVLKKLRTNLGLFKFTDTEGQVVVSREAAKDPNLLAAVLMHEIGHMEDWLPDKTLARGNLLGRIHKQLRFMKSTFGDKGPTNKAIREELISLVEWWNNIDREALSKKFKKYKFSSRELYAEALSVFLNDPDALRQRAPLFWAAWMEALDKRMDFAEELANAYSMLQAGSQERFAQNFQWTKLGYRKAADVLQGAANARRAARKNFSGGLYNSLIQALVDRTYPAKKRVRAVAGGRLIPRDSDPYILEKQIHDLFYNHTIENHTRKQIDEIIAPLYERGVTDDHIGFYMQQYRIVNERGEIGNPGATTPEAAMVNLTGLEEMIGTENMQKVREAVQRLHDDVLFPIVRMAYRAGVITPEAYVTAQKNKGTYATFAVLRHLEEQMAISAGIHQQVGTFGQVANPFHATVIKMLKLARWARLNRAKRGVIEAINKYWPNDTLVEVPTNRLTGQPKRRAKPGKAMLAVWEKGVKKHYEVEQEVADAFNQLDLGSLAQFFGIVGSKIYPIWHAALVEHNPDFLTRNPVRDLRRALRNMAAILHAEKNNYVDELVERGVPKQEARRRANERFTFDTARFTARFLKYMKDKHAREGKIDELVRVGAIGDLFTDPLYGYEHKVRLPGDITEQELSWNRKLIKSTNKWVRRAAIPLAKTLEVARAQELGMKVAAWETFREAGVPAHKAAMYVRKWMGTPDIHQRGSATVVANNVFLYFKVRVNGLMADAQLATSPQTALAWWSHTVRWALIPTVLKKAAQYGLFGAGVAAMMSGIGNYFLNNYLMVVPLGTFTDSDGTLKTRYLKLKGDDFDVLASSIFGHLIDLFVFDMVQHRRYKSRAAALQDLFGDVLREVTTSVAPPFSMIGAYADYLSGRNPIDPYTGREIIPRDAFDAGPWYGTQELLWWSFDQFGRWRWTMRNLASVFGLGGGEFTYEALLGGVPALRAVVGISDYGRDEVQRAALEAEDAERARLRVNLPKQTRDSLRRYYYLNRLPERTPEQETERLLLNYWYAHVYVPMTHDAQAHKDAGDGDKFKELLTALGELTPRYLEPEPGSEEWKRIAGDLLYQLSSPTEENRKKTLAKLSQAPPSPERAAYLQELKEEIVTNEVQRERLLDALRRLKVPPSQWESLLRQFYNERNRQRAVRTGVRPKRVTRMQGFRLTTFGQRVRRLKKLSQQFK